MLEFSVSAFLILCLAIGIEGDTFTFANRVGTGYFVPHLNVLNPGSFVGGRSMYKSIPANCIITTKNKESARELKYFKNTESYMTSICTQTSISASLKNSYTMTASLTASSSKFSSSSQEASGTSLYMYSHVMEKTLNLNCHKELDPTFKAAFESLPQVVNNPQYATSWTDYYNFLVRYGSHVVTGASFGASLVETTFAETSQHYTENQFKLRACASVAGVTEAGKLQVSGCFGLSTSEMKKSMNYAMTNTINCFGGNTEDRNKVLSTINRTPENIEKFLNSAGENTIVKIKLKEIWVDLKSKYSGTVHYAKAVNLQNYFIGYLGFGCGYLTSHGTVLKEFVRNDRYTDNNPQYTCRIQQWGCHQDSDCKIGGSGFVCYCYGNTCINYTSKTVANRKINIPMVQSWKSGSYKDGVNHTCSYKFPHKCRCYGKATWNNEWSSASAISKKK